MRLAFGVLGESTTMNIVPAFRSTLLVLLLGLAAATGRPVLTRATQLRILRGFVSEPVVESLYRDILDVAVPGPRDNFHHNLIGIKGDAGRSVEGLPSSERVAKLNDMLRYGEEKEESSVDRESGILRIELLEQFPYHRTKEIINDVVDNRVLEESGTIHLYMSRPDSAALANHTDTTEIVVLQLHGAKEWFLCQETVFHLNNREKLNGCSTYNKIEVDELDCERETLFPGDALYLPKRVVHSARATEHGLSAHLTFAFADDTCWADSGEGFDGNIRREKPERTRDLATATCTRAEGGQNCNTACNSNCPSTCSSSAGGSSCNICNSCTCNSSEGGRSCDSSCDECNSSCDSGCNTLCNGGCNRCNSECDCQCDCWVITRAGCCDGCCNENCNSDCNSSCDGSCNTSCDSFCTGSCDTSCDAGCPSTCGPSGGTSCDDGCDICPPCTSAEGGTDCQETCEICPSANSTGRATNSTGRATNSTGRASSDQSSASSGGSGASLAIIIGAVIGVAVGLMLAILGIVVCAKHRCRSNKSNLDEDPPASEALPSPTSSITGFEGGGPVSGHTSASAFASEDSVETDMAVIARCSFSSQTTSKDSSDIFETKANGAFQMSGSNAADISVDEDKELPAGLSSSNQTTSKDPSGIFETTADGPFQTSGSNAANISVDEDQELPAGLSSGDRAASKDPPGIFETEADEPSQASGSDASDKYGSLVSL